MTTAPKNSTAGSQARAKIIEVFGADLRSLAVFRVVVALLVLADLAGRATDLHQHYTDAGILPRTVLIEELLSPWAFSLNLMNGQPFFQALLFGAAALAALGMLVGYRTRLMTVVVWVVLLSIQWRNPFVGGADGPLLRLLLFWGMFLPLGAYWSVDRALAGARRWLSPRFLSVATVGLFMQIAFVYWFTAALKSGPDWRVDGTAIYYALSLDQIATPIGQYLLNFPELLKVMTFATFGLEAIGPLFLFFPFFTGPVRTAAVLAFMSLHFGIWLTMDIGIFPWTSAFCMVCFLPTWFWDKAARLRAALPERLDILRRLQHSAAGVGRAYWETLRARLPSPAAGATSASPAAGGDNRAGSDPARMTAAPVAPVAQTTQQEQATVGHEVQHGTPPEPGPVVLRSPLAAELLALFFLLYVLCWNLSTVSALTMPERAAPLGPFLGLDQYWGMFAPGPPRTDGWYVIPGELRGGERVDLMPVTRGDYREHEVSWEKPQSVNSTFENERWRKYLENLYSEQWSSQRLHFGRYICREWNARHTGAEELINLQIVHMKVRTLPDYQRTTPEKEVLWNHDCS
jgi:vitamin K-dependent gamma-carboxylase-like protein